MSKNKGILSWWGEKKSGTLTKKYDLGPMTQERANGRLYDYCRQYLHTPNMSKITKCLAEYSDLIDLTSNKGQIFSVAFFSTSDEYINTSLLNVLLNFYTETKLQDPKDSDEYKEAYFQLQEALYQAMDRDNYSDGIKGILARYNIEIEDEPESVEYYEQKTEAIIDNRCENMSITDEDKFYDGDISGADKALLIGEGDIEETLLLTTPNLTAKQYPYCQVNRQAEEYYAAHQSELCLKYISGAAGAIAKNSSIHANVQEKSRILYNYLKFTAEFGGGWGDGSDKLLATIWELATNTYKETILYAIKDNNRDIVELFLQKNLALVSIVDDYGQTPLHFAANNFELIQLLLAMASPEDIIKQAEHNHNYTALHLAVHAKNNEVVKLLLREAPSLVHVADEYGQTPLHFAANNFALMQLLLDVASSEDILHKAEGNHDYTALDLAIRYKNNEVVSLLASKTGECDVNEIVKGVSDISFYNDDHSVATTQDRESGLSEDLPLLGGELGEVIH